MNWTPFVAVPVMIMVRLLRNHLYRKKLADQQTPSNCNQPTSYTCISRPQSRQVITRQPSIVQPILPRVKKVKPNIEVPTEQVTIPPPEPVEPTDFQNNHFLDLLEKEEELYQISKGKIYHKLQRKKAKVVSKEVLKHICQKEEEDVHSTGTSYSEKQPEIRINEE